MRVAIKTYKVVSINERVVKSSRKIHTQDAKIPKHLQYNVIIQHTYMYNHTHTQPFTHTYAHKLYHAYKINRCQNTLERHVTNIKARLTRRVLTYIFNELMYD